MFLMLLLAKNCRELSHILHYIIQASYKRKMCIQRGTACRQPSVRLSVVVIEIWASIFCAE